MAWMVGKEATRGFEYYREERPRSIRRYDKRSAKRREERSWKREAEKEMSER